MRTPSDIISSGKWSTLLRRFLLTFLPLVLFFGSLALLQYYKDVKTEQLTVEKSEFFNINSQLQIVESSFSSVISDLKFLGMQSAVTNYLRQSTSEKRRLLAEELLTFSRIKTNYNQIQYLAEKGLEIIRINSNNGNPSITPEDKLQSHATKIFFNETKKLLQNEVYVSPFNHSIESDRAKDSFRAIIRFSMPIFDERGLRHGIIALQYNGAFLIENLETSSSNSPGINILATSDGYFINNPDQHGEWDAIFPGHNSSNIYNFLPEEWKRIQAKESGQFRTSNGLITFSTIYPVLAGMQKTKDHKAGNIQTNQIKYLWKTISFIPDKVLSAWPEMILGRILLIFTVIIIIIAISSMLLARTSLRERKAEEARIESEEELRAINEAAANAIIVIDNNKNVLHWNPAAEKLFQYTPEEVMKKPVTSIISPPTHQSTFTKISKRFKMPDQDSMEAKTIELFGYKKDGTEFPVEVSFSAFKSKDQWHTVGIIRDISARKHMEREVLRAQKFESLGNLSSGIANDFNNLLTTILGNVNLLGKIIGPQQEQYELLQNAEKAARQAKALSQQLLTFSKGGNPVRQVTSIKALIQESVDFALYGSSIPCNLEIPDALWHVDIDKAQIGQLIQNLTLNARQAISGSGTINITCRNVTNADDMEIPDYLKGNYIEIAISDNGQGIPKNHLAKIFDPYFTSKDHGSGLGLTIACSIIQKHDGNITVNSEIDKGSTFTFYLPAAVDQPIINAEPTDKVSGNHYKILVVDNETMLLNIAERVLTHLGHECFCAKSALEAIDIYKHHWKTGSPMDGVIMDLMLPDDGMGGKEVAGAIFDINSEAKIIVLSGYSNDPVMVDYDEYGFCAAIAKPFDMSELSEVIDSVLV